MNVTNVTNFTTCTAAVPPSDEEQPDLIPLGIIVGLLASIGINIGQNLEQRHAIGRAERNYRTYRFALFLIVISATSNFAAFAFAPASVLAPLEGAQFIANFGYNLAIGNEILKANFGKILVGTLVIVAGVALPVVSTPGNVARFDKDALWCFWGREQWLILLTSGIAVGLASLVAFYVLTNRPKAQRKFNKVGESLSLLEQLTYSIFSTVVGAFAVVNAKIISELLELIFRGHVSLFGEWLLWQTVIFVAAGFYGWVRLLQKGTHLFPGLSVIPLLQGLYILNSSVAGGVYFEEFLAMDDRQLGLYIGGMAILLLGLALLIPTKFPEMPNNDSDDSYLGKRPMIPKKEESNPTNPTSGPSVQIVFLSPAFVTSAFGVFPMLLYPQGDYAPVATSLPSERANPAPPAALPLLAIGKTGS